MADIESLVTEEPAVKEKAEETAGEPIAAEIIMPPQLRRQAAAQVKPELRFAEDILAPRRVKETEKPAKAKKKKKGGFVKEGEEGVKAKKGRRDYGQAEDEEEYF
jgi:hypothetical protein